MKIVLYILLLTLNIARFSPITFIYSRQGAHHHAPIPERVAYFSLDDLLRSAEREVNKGWVILKKDPNALIVGQYNTETGRLLKTVTIYNKLGVTVRFEGKHIHCVPRAPVCEVSSSLHLFASC